MHILDTNIYQLRNDQLKALEQRIEEVFREITILFRAGNYDEILERYVCYSPSGDDMGCENYYINFSWNDKEKDIGDIINMAKRLKEIEE